MSELSPRRCAECGGIFYAARSHAEMCSVRCRVVRSRRRKAHEAAFQFLADHGAEIRAAIAEGREPDRALLDRLGARMDHESDVAAGVIDPTTRPSRPYGTRRPD